MGDDTEHRHDHRGDDVRTDAGDDDGRWLSLGVAARVLGISRSSVYGRVRRGTLAARPLGNRGLEVLVPAATHDVAGDDVGNDRGEDADNVAATLREELAAAQVAIGRLEERLAAAGELREAVEARAAANAAALREALTKAEVRADRLEAALAEARRPWLTRVLEGLRRRG